MRIKLVENLPVSLASRLRARGHDADTVMDEGLAGRPDESVWEATQAEQWRAGDHIQAWFADPAADGWARCVVVASPTKVRVVRPGK